MTEETIAAVPGPQQLDVVRDQVQAELRSGTADGALAILVTVAMVCNLLVASIAGVLVPMAMKLIRVDPATSSTSLLTTVTDIAGIVLYLGPATLLLAVFAT